MARGPVEGDGGLLRRHLGCGVEASELPSLAGVVGWVFDPMYGSLIIGVHVDLLACRCHLGSVFECSRYAFELAIVDDLLIADVCSVEMRLFAFTAVVSNGEGDSDAVTFRNRGRVRVDGKEVGAQGRQYGRAMYLCFFVLGERQSCQQSIQSAV